MRHPEVPLLFTSYTLSEARKDLALIRDLNNKVDLCVDASCERNPYRSHRPIRDFEFNENDDCFFNNNFFSVVRRKKE